ncbi:MAG TPA: amino acid ABC transporter ATP-binding protein [Planctomycetota bacterium]|nr:amino acid ABC transporter ATP-binding protein [Planctomycetota bacterium]
MIRVTDLVKRHGGQEVLRGVSLEVEKGDVAVVIGPSGGGKSTFLRCLNGLERLDGGVIEVDGVTLRTGLTPVDEARALREIRARVGMVFQQFHLFPHRTVLENVMEAPIHVARRPAAEVREKALALLERVGLSAKVGEKPGRLSGGEQQRVAIARALAMEPEVILFDEPTSALDPRMTREVLSVMADLAAEGQTMIVVTHAMDFARRAANKVHVFHEGRVLESGPPQSVLEAPRERITREFLQMGVGGVE